MPKRKRKSVNLPHRKRKTSLAPAQQPSSQDQPRPHGRPRKTPVHSRNAIDERTDSETEDDEAISHVNERQEHGEDVVSDESQPEGGEEEDEDDDDEPDQTDGDNAPQFAAETVYIRQDTINKKWELIPNVSQQAIRQLFADAARPVIAFQLGERAGKDAEAAEGKLAEAQRAIERIMSTLTKRLPKMRLPPKTSTDDFNYEKLVRDAAQAKAQLAEQTTGIATLRSALQKSQEGKEKAKEKATGLEDKVQQQEAEFEARVKGRFERILRLPSEEPEDSARRIRLATSSKTADQDAKSLTSKLITYVQSMTSDSGPGTVTDFSLDRTLTALEHLRRRSEQMLEAG